LTEVGIEHVGMDYLEARLGGEFQAEMIYQERVQLNGDDAGGALQEFFGEGATAGSDFDREVDWIGAGRRRNALQNGAPNQEMLTEFLARHPVASREP
jgi:hypothetical protein